MNINKLPLEILEKILFVGNYFIISKVCQKWYAIAKSRKSKFNKVFFNLNKKVKENSHVEYVYKSQLYNNSLKFDFNFSLKLPSNFKKEIKFDGNINKIEFVFRIV